MSEHMTVKGKIDFHHLPMDEEGSFSYCHHCNKSLGTLWIELHQGIVHDWTLARCPLCKKAIWTAELTTDEEDYPKSGGYRHTIKEKRKCVMCGKATNEFDCSSYSFGKRNKIMCYCTERCYNASWKKKKQDTSKAKTKQRTQKTSATGARKKSGRKN
jgi:hypothetical protein